MRHRHGYRKLSRTSSHRKALLKNLAIALIMHERIETTVAKAKTLRSYIEKLITKARVGDFNAHRDVFAYLQDKEATKKLMNEIAPDIRSVRVDIQELSKLAYDEETQLLWPLSNLSKIVGFSPIILINFFF